MTFSPHLHGQEPGSMSWVGSKCWSASWVFPWVHPSSVYLPFVVRPPSFPCVFPKVCQGDLGIYILDLYGTNECHLSWHRVQFRFRQSGLVTGRYVEHCSASKGFLQAPSLNLKVIIAMWRHTSSTKSTQTLILPVPLDPAIRCPHSILNPIA